MTAFNRKTLTTMIDFGVVTPALGTFVNAAGSAVSQSGGGALCSWTSATSGQYCGVKYENPTGTWDFTGGDVGIDMDFIHSANSTGAVRTYIQIYLCMDAGTAFTNYIRSEVMVSGFSKFNKYLLHNIAWNTATGTVNFAAVKRVEVRIYANSTTAWAQSFRVNKIYKNTSGKAAVVLNFDDEYTSLYTTALPIMQTYGIKGSLFVDSSKVGESGYMTWAQIQELIDDGWTVSPHTHGHNPLVMGLGITSVTTTATATLGNGFLHGFTAGVSTVTIIGAYEPEYNGTFTVATTPTTSSFTYTMTGTPVAATATGRPTYHHKTDGAIRTQMQDCKDLMDANLTGHDTTLFSYPHGRYDDASIALIQNEFGIVQARQSDSGGWPSYCCDIQTGNIDRFRIPAIILNNTTVAATYLGYVDTCILHSAGMWIYGHGIGTADTVTVDTTVFTNIVKGLYQRWMEGKIDLLTARQFYDRT